MDGQAQAMASHAYLNAFHTNQGQCTRGERASARASERSRACRFHIVSLVLTLLFFALFFPIFVIWFRRRFECSFKTNVCSDAAVRAHRTPASTSCELV